MGDITVISNGDIITVSSNGDITVICILKAPTYI